MKAHRHELCRETWRWHDETGARGSHHIAVPHCSECGEGIKQPDRDTPPGTRVRVLEDITNFGQVVIKAGEIGTTKWSPSGPHATANGGGWDVHLMFEGKRFDGFTPNYDKNPDGSYVLIKDKSDWITIRSTRLSID